MRRKSQLLMLCLVLLVSGVTQGAFKFVAWADNRPYDAANEARFIWMLQQMNEIVGSEPAFHVVPGDYDYTDITNADIQAHSDIKLWYEAPGNHDLSDLSMSHYVVDYPEGTPEARLIFLNEYICPAGVHDCSTGRVCPDTLAWLEDQLMNAPDNVALFVVGHEPAYPETRHVGDSLDSNVPERDAFWALLGQYGAPYICGHTHYYRTYSSGGATQIDVGNAGNPGDSFQTFVLFTVDGGSYDYNAYTTEYNVSAYPAATNPMPADGTSGISTTPVLTWTGGNGATHNVYFAAVADGLPAAPVKSTDLSSCTVKELSGYTDGLNYNTQYVWRVDEVYDAEHITQGPVWTFRTKEELAIRKAIGETPIDGAVVGDIDGTEHREDVYEELSEVLNVPNKNGYGILEHIWRFDNVPAGANQQFRIEAYRSDYDLSDVFELSYSTDGSSYAFLMSIAKVSDDNTNTEDIVTFAEPGIISGTVWVKVKNTDHVKGSGTCDTLYVDCMYLVSSDERIPDVVVPLASGNQAPIANAGADQSFNVETPEDVVSVALDGSASSDPDGTIDSYEWDVDSNGSIDAQGAIVTLPFGVGVHTVTLKVTDNEGASATDQVTITVQTPAANQPPIANAGVDQIVTDAEGDGETVTLNGSASSDPDGTITIVSYEWDIDGDGSADRTGVTTSYDFAVGTHTVTLKVTDNEGLTDTDQVNITVQTEAGTMHVADLDGVVNLRGSSGQWAALVTITIADFNGDAVFGATVTGAWGDPAGGTSTGITGTDGRVTLSSNNMKSGSNVTFTTTDVTHSALTYDSGSNDDPDDDSDGTTITVAK